MSSFRPLTKLRLVSDRYALCIQHRRSELPYLWQFSLTDSELISRTWTLSLSLRLTPQAKECLFVGRVAFSAPQGQIHNTLEFFFHFNKVSANPCGLTGGEFMAVL